MAPYRRLALALPLAFTSCVFVHASDEDTCRVGGVLLEKQHVETLELGAWHRSGLALEAHCGDVTVVATDGPTRVVATLREKELGDARLVYADGILSVVTASGAPAALRDVTLHAHGEIPGLSIESGLGDVHVEGVGVAGDCALETGLGDVVIAGVDVGGAVVASTGMGDVAIRDLTCATGSASSGMGDVVLQRVEAQDVEASTGMGDVELLASTLQRVEASSGMGDVRCVDTTYASSDLSTGMGSVTR